MEPDAVPAAPVPWYVRFTRWRQTSLAEGRDAERRVLGLFPTASGPMAAREVAVGPGREDYLHTLEGGPREGPPVVLMPGYGAGVGFFYRNFPGLAARMRLLSVDWLGTGLSGRPGWGVRGSGPGDGRQAAESWFLDSLTAWRRAEGLEGEKMVLVGHSLGGYLAACYALRHPDHVAHLVLVCPAGVPKAPEDWERHWLGDKWSLRGTLFRTFMWGWEQGITPGGVIRALGPWGQRLVHKYVAGRFAHHGEGLSEREIAAFRDYFYSIAALPGSGEYALRHLLAPGAWAHSPLEERLHELRVPVTFIYGKHDWMRPEHAVRLCERLRAERAPRCPGDLAVEIIDDAGHFVFMDQPELFDKALTAVVAPYLTSDAQRRRAGAYAAAGTAVGPAPEAGRQPGAAAAAAGQGPAAVSWGFAAKGLDGGAGKGAEQGEAAEDGEEGAVGEEDVRPEVAAAGQQPGGAPRAR